MILYKPSKKPIKAIIATTTMILSKELFFGLLLDSPIILQDAIG